MTMENQGISALRRSRGRVAHLVRRYGAPSQPFIVDAVLAAERRGWEGWVVTQMPAANRSTYSEPPDWRLARAERPSRRRQIAARLAGRSVRERGAEWWLPALSRARPDVIHIHFGWTAAAIHADRLPAPVVVSFHGSDVNAWPHHHPRNLRMYEELFREIDRATATSNFIAGRLRGLGYEGPLDILPPGIRLDEFAWRPPAERGRTEATRLLFVGRQVDCKGLDVLVRALALIGSDRGYVLDVIGDGEERHVYEELVRDAGLGDQVRFLGAQPRPRVAEALERSDILVVPSRVTNMGEAEGSPVAPKEAMAVGLPVVATDVGGLSEVTPPEYRHELVPGDEPAALASRIRHLLEHPDEWLERSRTGRAWVEEQFDADALAARMVRIYEDLSGPSTTRETDPVATAHAAASSDT
jgi:colanic acid/amylovoran biosynthesis glycosyltransferase